MARVLTGVKATGVHIGNWIGAIKPALELVEDSAHEGLFFIADYHALNTIKNGEEISQITSEVAATWLALGLDPKKSILYKQSDIPEIMELNVILASFTSKGLLNRAHAYKAKLQKNEEEGKKDLDDGVNMGLFTYPLLMTADILAFNADKVPVGEDNAQHLEIARDIAGKFNRFYLKKSKDDVLVSPELVTIKGELLPGLDGRKMSASYNNHIPVFLNEKKLRKRIMKITTDSTPPEEPKNKDVNSLFKLYKTFATEEQVKEMSVKYDNGIAWGEVKQEFFEVLNNKLKQPREVYNYYMEDQKVLNDILREGAERARVISKSVLKDVKKVIGVLR